MEAVARDRRLAGRYLLVERLGPGGMTEVWRARDEVLARTVTAQVLRGDLTRDPDFLQRFYGDSVSSARLAHPCIVNVFDTRMESDGCYIVTEYFESRSLEGLLGENGPMEWRRAVNLMYPVLSALAFAHSDGVIHGDVRPANILLAGDGRVKVKDFAIAGAASGGDFQRVDALLGTTAYLSPEQAVGREAGPASDMYSAGLVLYELLTGRVPFAGSDPATVARMRLKGAPLPPRALRPGIPRRIEAVALRAMELRPQDRFGSVEEMRTALERAASPEQEGGRRLAASALRPAPWPDSMTETQARSMDVKPPSSRLRPWILVPAALLLVLALVTFGRLALDRVDIGNPAARPPAERPSNRVGAPVPVPIEGASDYDPEGDGGEHPDELPLAIDGNPETGWSTDHYSSSAFGNLKSGLGLSLRLRGAHTVRRISLTSSLPGWRFQVKEGSPEGLSPPLPSTGGATAFSMPASGRSVIDLRPVDAEALLIWITALAPDGRGYAARIDEVVVQA